MDKQVAAILQKRDPLDEKINQLVTVKVIVLENKTFH